MIELKDPFFKKPSKGNLFHRIPMMSLRYYCLTASVRRNNDYSRRVN